MDSMVPQGLPATLRGDYASANADFTLAQRWDGYTAADHAMWRTLHATQSLLLPAHAARAFREGLSAMGCAGGIPDFDALSARLRAATGWSLVAVPGLIPDGAFYEHLAARRFPATVWIRTPEELDYLVEPDLFHDVFGHVPLLFQPEFAAFVEAYGRMGVRAAGLGALKPMTRLYWHMVEFGLVREDGGIRAYGAGILSSRTETLHATAPRRARRLRFDPWRVLRSDFLIDDLQPTYFVVDSYAQLFAAAERIPALLEAARDAEPIPPGAGDAGYEPA
jgi:phenylalanine-4-hydroxylase